MANTDAVIESGNRSCLTTMAVLDLLNVCFDMLIAVSILSLPSILPVSGLFVAVSFATGLVGLEVLGFEGLDGLGAGIVAGVDFGSFGSEPFASSSASVNPSPRHLCL